VLQRKPEVADPSPKTFTRVGCVVRLAKMVKFPDGTARVLVEGLWRIRIKDYVSTAYPDCEVRNCCRMSAKTRSKSRQ
jgi:ATP-dependent Lon protease